MRTRTAPRLLRRRPGRSRSASKPRRRARTPRATDAPRDLRNLLWASIDNDDSRDLDQLSVAEALPGDKIKVLVAIADVDAVIDGLAAIDLHARHNTTSVYTAAAIFPMLPEKLSTDITSLGLAADRQAIVVEMVVAADGIGAGSRRSIGRGCGTRPSWPTTAWPPGWKAAPAPAAVAAVPGLDANLRLQDKAAQSLKGLRQLHGALTFETLQGRAKFEGDEVRDLEVEKPNRATQLIEDFMVAANGVTAEFLEQQEVPLPAPRGPHAQTLGPDRRDRPAAWVQTAGRARLAGA